MLSKDFLFLQSNVPAHKSHVGMQTVLLDLESEHPPSPIQQLYLNRLIIYLSNWNKTSNVVNLSTKNWVESWGVLACRARQNISSFDRSRNGADLLVNDWVFNFLCFYRILQYINAFKNFGHQILPKMHYTHFCLQFFVGLPLFAQLSVTINLTNNGFAMTDLNVVVFKYYLRKTFILQLVLHKVVEEFCKLEISGEHLVHIATHYLHHVLVIMPNENSCVKITYSFQSFVSWNHHEEFWKLKMIRGHLVHPIIFIMFW